MEYGPNLVPGFSVIMEEWNYTVRIRHMSERTNQIKDTFERHAKAMALRPSAGRGTATTRVALRDGVTCDVKTDLRLGNLQSL
jgi:hypothetical protein